MKKVIIALVAALSLAFGAAPLAQAPAASPASHEVSTSVPELTKFHDVIMPMWHTAYPAKVYAALRRFSKVVESGVATAQQMAAVQQGLPPEQRPHSAEALAKLLVQRGMLTKYQALKGTYSTTALIENIQAVPARKRAAA